MNLPESTEMYLKTILNLEKRNSNVRAIDIARELQFSRPTVSQQVKNLSSHGFIELNDKKHIQLTAKGRQVAEVTNRFHDGLIEFFTELGVSEETAQEDACRIEHYISQETFDRMQDFLKNCKQHLEEHGA